MVIVVDGGTVVGPPGYSVLVTPIPVGSATCPAGGVRVTQLSDAGISNVCNGTAGAQGPQGLQGPQGAPGAGVSVTVLATMSPQCPTGGLLVTQGDGGTTAVCNGAQGAQGMTGAQGPQGMTGAQGPQGMTGPQGPQGPTGETGAQGPQGVQGPQGPQGPMGPPGAVLYLDGGVVLPTPNAVTFAGYTVAQFTGDLGGIAGANTKCRVEFPGSTFCTASDVHQSEPDTGAPAAGAWVDFDRDALGNRASSPCNNGNGQWSYGAGTVDTSTYLTPTGATSTSYCNATRPISCCYRTPRRIFRGFTSLSFTGDLGGFVGANAKCRAEFPGSYFCASSDYALADTTAVPGATGAWIDYDRDSSGQRASSPCNNGQGSWTYGTGTVDTSTYLSSNGTITTSYCNVSRPIACCQTP